MPDLATLALMVPPVLAALTIHEFAHGLVAYRLGDPTARMEGRLTLNPIAHLDPIGTILLFIAYFGWAKPVPVNPGYFENPRRDMVWVAVAGPASNVLLAAILGVVLNLLMTMGAIELMDVFYRMMTLGVFLNLMLAFFNMIPIPPLDGSKVVAGFVPLRYLGIWQQFERYGPIVLLGIILFSWVTKTSLFGKTILPLAERFYILFTGGAPLGF